MKFESFDGNHCTPSAMAFGGFDNEPPRLTSISRLFSVLVNLIAY
jgi:hypothetical protein